MRRVDGGWLLTDEEVGIIVLNQLGMKMGKESVLTLATPRERAVLDACAAIPNDDLVEVLAENYSYAPGDALVRAILALRAVKP